MSGISRRSLLFGAGGVVLGGVITTAVGLTFRSQIRDLMGRERLYLPESSQDDGWLLIESERIIFESEFGG